MKPKQPAFPEAGSRPGLRDMSRGVPCGSRRKIPQAMAMFAGLMLSVWAVADRPIRAIVAEKYPGGNVWIGMAAHGERVRANHLLAILNREFSYVTPANDMKQSYIHPSPGKWQWSLPAWWLSNAAAHGQTLRVHGPISPQCGAWYLEDQRTPEEMRAEMNQYLSAVVARWSREPAIRWVDVVNETWDEEHWFGPKPGTDAWENPWLILGLEKGRDGEDYPVYIREAFEAWQKGDSRIKRVLNQHEISSKTCEKMKGLIGHLRGRGLQVDGFGWQAHLDTGWENEGNNLEVLHDMIQWCHENRLEFHVTEFQANLLTKKERPTKWNKNPKPVSAEERTVRLAPQADTFGAVLSALLEHRNRGVVALNYWHLTDSQSQNKDGNMFEEDGTPRPACRRIKEILENPPKAR